MVARRSCIYLRGASSLHPACILLAYKYLPTVLGHTLYVVTLHLVLGSAALQRLPSGQLHASRPLQRLHTVHGLPASGAGHQVILWYNHKYLTMGDE